MQSFYSSKLFRLKRVIKKALAALHRRGKIIHRRVLAVHPEITLLSVLLEVARLLFVRHSV